MSKKNKKRPCLLKFYSRYLDTEDVATFIKSVSTRYTCATLQRLAEYGPPVTRRAAILSIGLLAGFEANGTLGRGLVDTDRGVRLLAENGIRQIWTRDGSESQRHWLNNIVRLNNAEQFDEAFREASELIDEAPWFAEAWNQRAIALFHRGDFEDSANDCHQTLELNPYHFAAAVGMAHCYLEMNDALAALESFRRALKLNPDMEGVRMQVEYLEKSLKER